MEVNSEGQLKEAIRFILSVYPYYIKYVFRCGKIAHEVWLNKKVLVSTQPCVLIYQFEELLTT